MAEDLSNGNVVAKKPRGYKARTALYFKEKENLKKDVVAYAAQLEHTIRLKKDIKKKVAKKFKIHVNTVSNYIRNANV